VGQCSRQASSLASTGTQGTQRNCAETRLAELVKLDLAGLCSTLFKLELVRLGSTLFKLDLVGLRSTPFKP